METDLLVADRTDKPSSAPRHPWKSIGIRAVLIGTTVLTAGVSPWIAVPLSVLAVAVTAEWAVRRRRQGIIDAAVVATAGVVIVTVLVGLLLNLLPAGLTTTSWSVAGGITAMLVLGIGAITPIPPSIWNQWRTGTPPASDNSDRRKLTPAMLLNTACSVAALLAIALALVISTNSAAATRIAPLEMAATTVGGEVQVTINTGSTTGPFDLLMVTGTNVATLAQGIVVDETNSVVVLVAVPQTGRTLLQLTPAGSTEALRELIFDYGVLTSVPTP